MANFSRSWRLLQLMFPGAFELGNPGQLSTQVVPTWDIFRLHIGECYLQAKTIIDVGTGASLDQAFPEPEAKRIFVPMSLTAYQDTAGGLAQVAAAFLIETTNSPDVWGRWNVTAPSASVSIGSASCPQAIGKRIPTISFIPRGNQMKVQWQGSILGSSVRTDFTWLNCPGEIVSVLPFLHEGGPA